MSYTVEIQVKESYGRILIYPLNDTAKLFTRLTGLKTLREEDMAVIKALGFVVEAKAMVPATFKV
jgi:hypothetical protein